MLRLRARPTTEPAPSRQPVEVWCEQDDDCIEVKAQAPGGLEWYLLTIKSDGTVYRHGAIPKDLGFSLDHDQRLRLAESRWS